jgi:glycolate oxidase FAD binding subunit
MASVVEYEPADLVVSVGAGITISELQAVLYPNRQFLAIDGTADHATIGGIVATNRSGPSRLLYGTVRDLVLGITAALPNGDVVRSGGRVVKNVVGYDLNRLHVGALGTLGLICEVTMKVHPLPRAEISVVGRFTSHAEANAVAHTLARSNLALRAVDVTTDLADPPAPFTTVVTAWCSGWAASVDRQAREVAAAFGRASASSIGTLSDDDHRAHRAQIESRRNRPARLKLAVLPDKLGSIQSEVAHALREAGHADPSWVARAGVGIAHVGLRDLDATVLSRLRAIAEAAGGTCTTEAAPPELRTPERAWGRTRDDFRIMARIRDEFDPSRTINPGRFVGGL